MANDIRISIASKADNQGLLALTKVTPMKGVISLIIDREPDFFNLLEYRGQHEVLILKQGSSIIGSFSVSFQTVLLNKRQETIYYLADFKVHPDYRSSSAAVRLVRAMLEYLQSISADLLFCTAADGNNRVMPFFEGRVGIPPWKDIGAFKVLQILPSRHPAAPEYDIRSSPPARCSLSAYYQSYYAEHYTLAPVIQAAEVDRMQHLVCCRGGEIIAAISLMDTGHMKQNVVVDMPFWLKAIVFLSKQLHKVVGRGSLPGVGESIRMLNIRYWAFNPGQEAALQALIQSARQMAAAQAFHFLSVGVQEKDPVLAVFGAFRHITFSSRGFATSLNHHQEKLQTMMDGLVFEDFSMV